LRGGGAFDAYLDPWQPSREVMVDGWFRTGDLGRRDAEGALQILGRCQSVINVGGLKVFPEEVEAVLDREAAVARSRVTARPHALLGAVPVAEVVAAPQARPDPQMLRAACRAALAPHKVPVAVVVVDSLPVTASGKLRR
jgi:long-chain acyl-CoA synthetase